MMKIEDIPIFAGLTEREVAHALDVFEQATVGHSVELIVEGDTDPTLLIVVDGELEIRTGDVELWTAGPGEMLGEISLFSGMPRTATVETNTESTILMLTKEGYETLVQREHSLAARLEQAALNSLVDRLHRVDERIGAMTNGESISAVTASKGIFQKLAGLFGGGGRQPLRGFDVLDALQRSRQFTGYPPESLKELAEYFVPFRFRSAEVLCEQGTLAKSAFLLVDGVVDVIVNAAGQEKVEPLATLQPGTLFGVAGLLNNRPRSATCIAKTPVTVLELTQERWEYSVGATGDGDRVLRLAMIQGLSGQLAFANGQLALLDLTSFASDLAPLWRAAASVDGQVQGHHE